jgi:hypothetical protein
VETGYLSGPYSAINPDNLPLLEQLQLCSCHRQVLGDRRLKMQRLQRTITLGLQGVEFVLVFLDDSLQVGLEFFGVYCRDSPS